MCSLVADEMSIREHVQFDGVNFKGVVDLGDGCGSTKPAKHALVLLVTSVNDHWKLPVAYYMIDSLTGSGEIN